MSCCSHCNATEEVFGKKDAERALRSYKKKGPGKTTQMLLREIRKTDLNDATLLDIGGGVGILHHELLGGQVTTATHIDASTYHNEAAIEEDKQRNIADLVNYLRGDAVEMKDQLPQADLVTLDKVICCYPDWEGLLRTSVEKSSRLVALSIPRDRWFVRIFIHMTNLFQKIKGSAFRVFVHPRESIDRTAESLGFEVVSAAENLAWQVAIYQKRD